MDGHNMDHRRVEEVGGGTRNLLAVSSGWTGQVDTLLAEQQSSHGHSQCRSSGPDPCLGGLPETSCRQSFH